MKTSARPTSPALTEEFRGRLAAMRRRLVRTVATTDEELATLEAVHEGETGEAAAVSVAEDLLARLDGRERHALDDIAAAQRRLESGAFGVCETCHRAVPLARLRAMPTARRCGPCQARLERAR